VKLLLVIVGLVVALLGGLWLVQGLGMVQIRPILCVANCEVLQGPSTTWTLVGLAALLIGAALIYIALRRRRARSR
jgi:hypothetical protein